MMQVKILNLYSNIAEAGSSLKGDHGQSFLITLGDEKILFDTGGKGSVLLHNMRALGVDPNAITRLVFSHGHYDHTRALPAFLDARTAADPLPVYAHPDFREAKFVKLLFLRKSIGCPGLNQEQEQKTRLNLSRESQEVVPLLYTTAEIRERPERDGVEPLVRHVEEGKPVVDPVYDDLSLVLRTPQGAVVIAGCAHSGILNICRYVRDVLGMPVRMIIGGTHMVHYSVDEVKHAARQFREVYGCPELYLNHCTDRLPVRAMKTTPVLDVLKRNYPAEKVLPCHVGTEISCEV